MRSELVVSGLTFCFLWHNRIYLFVGVHSTYLSLLSTGDILIPYTFDVIHVDPGQFRFHIESICP